MQFLGHVGVPVEHERSGVRVRSHVPENQPVTDLSALEHSLITRAYLIKAVTCRSENRGWDFLDLDRGVNYRLQGLWFRVVVVINHIVERAIDTIVNVESLLVGSTTFTAVDFSCDRS